MLVQKKCLAITHSNNCPNNLKIINEILRASDNPDTFLKQRIKKRIHHIYNSTPKNIENN